MHYTWLNKKNNRKIIIFFNGWGMDETVVSHLNPEDFDVLEIHDYTNLDNSIVLDNYKEKHIVAWSMGVMIAGIDNENINNLIKDYTNAVALCGTPYPINNAYGIPKKIYDLTLKGFSEQSSKKFIERMFTGTDSVQTNRNFNNQKEELVKLTEYKFSKLNYAKVIIPDNDIIIPTKNQKNYWEKINGIKIININSGHYPFGLYKSWAEIL